MYGREVGGGIAAGFMEGLFIPPDMRQTPAITATNNDLLQ